MTAALDPTLSFDRIRHFLSDPNDAPPYGYQDNPITGVGFILMQGARYALSIYERGSEAPTFMEQAVQKTAALFVAFATLPLTAIGALLKEIGSQFPHKVDNLTIDKIPKTPPEKVDQIYDLLQIVSKILNTHQITYMMDGGTLLGAKRHEGVIPWDDDGDLLIIEKDKKKLLALKNEFEAHGIIMQDGGLDAFKLTFDEKTLKERYGISQTQVANLDIFVMREQPDGKIRYTNALFRHQFPKEYFFKSEWENLQEYPFGPQEKGLRLKGPKEPMRYLKTYFGPECFDYAIQTHSHIQLGPFSFPIINFSKTRYKIVNPTCAEGNIWKNGRRR